MNQEVSNFLSLFAKRLKNDLASDYLQAAHSQELLVIVVASQYSSLSWCTGQISSVKRLDDSGWGSTGPGGSGI